MKTSFHIKVEDTTPKEFNRYKDIFNYGNGNDYPEQAKKVINNSVTAKACSELIGSYFYGKGFDNNDFYLNRDRDTPNSLFRKATVEASYYRGFAIHIGYNALGQKTSFKSVPFDWCRKSREDVSGYITKIKVCKDWNDRKESESEYDVYNPEQALNQIKKVGIDKYKGQILYVSFSYQDVYPKSWIDSVYNDCISEAQSGLFKRNLLTRGFSKNTIVVTRPFDKEEAKENFRNGLQSQLGAKGVGGVNHIEADLDSDDLSGEIYTADIGSDLNDQLFKYTDENVGNKICVAYGIPPALVMNNDNSLFGSSGNAIYNLKMFVQERTEGIRGDIEEVFNDLFTNTVSDKLNSTYFEVLPLIEKIEVKDDTTN